MGVCRALVLDDDVRVEFGKAHEHARIIASECLCALTNLLSRKYSFSKYLVEVCIICNKIFNFDNKRIFYVRF